MSTLPLQSLQRALRQPQCYANRSRRVFAKYGRQRDAAVPDIRLSPRRWQRARDHGDSR